MENRSREEARKKFIDFANALEQRVSDVGAKKMSSARSADVVMEKLFKNSGGDPENVSDDQISELFDTVDDTDG